MSNKMKFSVIIPAFNEERTISNIINDLTSELVKDYSNNDFEIIVVDDGSTDNTGKEVLKNGKAKLITNKENSGKGFSMRKGVMLACGELVCFVDGDGSHSSSDLKIALKIVGKFRSRRKIMITGVRFWTNEHGTSTFNAIGNKIYSHIAKLLWARRINDLTCGLRIIYKEDFMLLKLNASRYTIEVEMIAQALKNRYQIIELPINAKPRQFGQSGVRALREGIIIPVSFILSSIGIFDIIAGKISV